MVILIKINQFPFNFFYTEGIPSAGAFMWAGGLGRILNAGDSVFGSGLVDDFFEGVGVGFFDGGGFFAGGGDADNG